MYRSTTGPNEVSVARAQSADEREDTIPAINAQLDQLLEMMARLENGISTTHSRLTAAGDGVGKSASPTTPKQKTSALRELRDKITEAQDQSARALDTARDIEARLFGIKEG